MLVRDLYVPDSLPDIQSTVSKHRRDIPVRNEMCLNHYRIRNERPVNCYAETPMTIAVTLAQPRDIIMALVDGGALLDFRTRGGLTPMHVAAKLGNCQAIKVSNDTVWM